MKITRSLIALLAVILVSLPVVAGAAVFSVSTVTEFRNALVSASNNSEDDTITVAAGTYDLSAGALEYYPGYTGFGSDNHALTIQGAGAGATILDGGDAAPILIIFPDLADDSGVDVTIRGITFQNAATDQSLQVRGTALSIILGESEFKDNTAAWTPGANLRSDTGTVTVQNCIFTNNTATSGSGGGLMADSEYSTVLLTNSIFRGNSAGESGGGAYLYTLTGTITATNNTFVSNSADDYGAGLMVEIFYDDAPGARANIYNNISYGNTGGSGTDIYVNDTDDTTGNPVYLYNNDFTYFVTKCQNTGGCTPTIYQGSNINQDPLLTSDSHLQSGSPCIDTGLNSAPSIPSEDIDGDNRIVNGTADMGADEYNPPVYHCVSSAGGLTTALSTAESNTTDDIIHLVKGTYTGNFYYSSSAGYSITLEGGYASGCGSREVNPANTVLDGGGVGRTLSLVNNSGGDIQVEGLTIQNGVNSIEAGGIYADSRSTSGTAGTITLLNNIITGNSTTHAGGGVYAYSYSNSGTAGNVALINNIVTGNTAGATYNGGGVYASSYSNSGSAGTVSLLNNIVAGNSSGNGGGVFASSSSNTFAGGTVTLTNNTITGTNTANNNGGGIYITMDGNTINCYNNIIWGNTATTAGHDVYLNGSGTAYGYNNDFSTPAGSTWYELVDIFTLDPLFVGGGDYRLRSASPCIEAGLNSAPRIQSTDFEGDTRITDGNYDSTATVDIGADEFVPVYVILHQDGAIWDETIGWDLNTPPYYPGTAYAKALVRTANSYTILHTDGAIYNTDTGWNTNTPPYYPGTAYAVDAAYTDEGDTMILHFDGAVWNSATGWNLATPPYYPGTAYAKALKVRENDSYVILHKEGAVYDSASGWDLAVHFPALEWAADLELLASSYVILHQDGALWLSDTGWVLDTPPYYAGTGYARDLEFVDGRYVILHQDGAIYNSLTGWLLTTPPYYSGTAYAVDLEVW